MTNPAPLSENYDSLVSELDAGIDPQGVFVAREKAGMRILGLVICMVVGAAAAAWTIALANEAAKMGRVFVMISGTAVFLGGCAFLLLYQVLFSSFYYVAMTDRDLMKRSGPRKLWAISLSDVATFEMPPGILCVRLRSGKRVILMKGAYAPESVTALGEKFHVWMHAPASERATLLARVEINSLLDRQRGANRLMLSGLFSAILSVVIIALAVAFPAIAKDSAFIAAFGFGASLVQIVVGGILRFQARTPATIPDSDSL